MRRTVIKISLLVITVMGVYSCTTPMPLVSGKADNNKTYPVEYLFEHDGCKVYRFQDQGNWVYFTNCKGDVTSIKNDSTQVRMMGSK